MSDDLPPDLERLFEALPSPEKEPTDYWLMRDGSKIKLSEMRLGHLTSAIKMMSAKLEQARLEGSRSASWIETKLMELQSELDSRGKEIDQVQGIYAALTRGRKNP